MKRKNKRGITSAFALTASLFAITAAAAPSAQHPIQIPVSPDSQVRVGLSNSEPNMLVVPGDRVVAIDSAQGMFVNGNEKGTMGAGNGGVVLMTAQTKPFTFYLRTAGGLTISVVAVPQKQDGRVLQFISDQPAKSVAAKRWEQSLPYPRTLIDIHKALLNDEIPDGFLFAPVTALPALNLPSVYQVSAQSMWNGGALRVYKLGVKNTSSVSQSLTERLFNQKGVRAVLIFPYSDNVLPGATATVWLTISNEVENG